MSGRKKTPREQAEDITAGKTAPHHIGEKTREVLLQEWWSMMNLKPAFQKPDHKWQVQQIEKELLNKYSVRDPMSEWRKVFKPTR